MTQSTILFAVVPFLSALALCIFGPRLGRAAGWIGFIGLGVAAALFTGVFFHSSESTLISSIPFIAAPHLAVDLAFRFDFLAMLAVGVLLGIGLLIQLHAAWTSPEMAKPWRFHAAGLAAIGFTILAIGAGNLIFMIAAWQGSTLMVAILTRCRRDGHSAGTAGARIVLTHLIGDAALLLGLFIVARFTGRFDLDSLLAKAPELATIPWMIPGISLLDFVAVLLFFGLAAKAAQFPLHSWFAETTETAPSGTALVQTIVLPLPAILLLLRLAPLWRLVPAAQGIVLDLAVFTAFVASLVALTQTDLVKAVSWLAMSRLGLIATGLVSGATAGATVLFVNHLFFITILFLAAGFIIRALGGIAEIRSMGGLWRRTPFAFSAFLIGAIGHLGLPATPGFEAIGLIAGAVLRFNPAAGVLLVATVLATPLALTRVMMTVFAGDERFDRQVLSGIRETPGMILLSLVMMAIGAFTIGHLTHADGLKILPALSTVLTAAVLSGLLIGVIRYRRRTPHSNPWKEFIRSGCGWPAVERSLIAIPFGAIAVWSRDVVDRVAISSVAEGLGHFGRGLGESMLPLRSLRLSTALTILVFAAAVLVWSLVR